MARGKSYKWTRTDVKRAISSFLSRRIANKITHRQLAETLERITGEKISRRTEEKDDVDIISQESNQESRNKLSSYSNLPMECRNLLDRVVDSVDNLFKKYAKGIQLI